MSIIDRFLNRAPQFERNALNEIDVRFHKEANHHVIHGYLVVTHKQMGIKEAPVAFSFPDFSDAPDLDLRLMIDLFEAAKAQGYIPLRLHSYGAVESMAQPKTDAEPETVGFTTPGFAGAADVSRTVLPFRTTPGVTPVDPTGIPAVLRLRPQSTTSQGFGAISRIHAEYADRVSQLPEEARELLEIQIDQVMTNGRALRQGADVVLAKLSNAYAKFFAERADVGRELSTDETAALQLHFGRMANGARTQLNGGAAPEVVVPH
jgi:hypothetical protein